MSDRTLQQVYEALAACVDKSGNLHLPPNFLGSTAIAIAWDAFFAGKTFDVDGVTIALHAGDVTVSGASLCSATAKFNTTDVNLPVSGANVGTFTKWITAVTPAGGAPCVAGQSKATLNVAGTNGANQVIVIGQPNATAPANNDAVSQLGAELSLDPNLVAGSPACSANVPTSFAIQGKWLNPGSFASTPFGDATSATLPNAPVIAQILYPTAAGISFSALVQPIPASTSGETATAPHYDVTFPLLPTALAMCASPSAVGVGADFRFNAVSASQGLLLTGTGMPSTAQIRALQDLPVGVAANAGIAFVGNVGSGTVLDFTALGDAVNIGARLQSHAAPGEVVLASDLYALVAAAHPGGRSERVTVRGRDEQVDVQVLTS